jgi:hypothetical protein
VIELQVSSYMTDDGQSWRSLPPTAGSFGHRSTSMPCGCVLTTTQMHHSTTTTNKGTLERSRTPPFNFQFCNRAPRLCHPLIPSIILYLRSTPPDRDPSAELERDICSRDLAMANMCQLQGETIVTLFRVATQKKMLRVRP